MDVLGELAPHGFVDGLSSAARSQLASQVHIRDVDPRTPLVQRGDLVGGVFLVQRGALRVFYIGPDGREGTLYWIEAGDACVLALNCVCSEQPYPAWAESEAEPSRIAIIPAAAFRFLLASEPAMQRYAFSVLARRVFELMRILEQASTFGLEQRIASVLLERAAGDGTVHMSQERVANHLGTAREVVSRLIRRLAQRGMLETRRGQLRILDLAALRGLVEP